MSRPDATRRQSGGFPVAGSELVIGEGPSTSAVRASTSQAPALSIQLGMTPPRRAHMSTTTLSGRNQPLVFVISGDGIKQIQCRRPAGTLVQIIFAQARCRSLDAMLGKRLAAINASSGRYVAGYGVTGEHDPEVLRCMRGVIEATGGAPCQTRHRQPLHQTANQLFR